MRLLLLIIILISFFNSFSQDNTHNFDTINLYNELKIDTTTLNFDTITISENINIKDQESEITIPHDSLKKKVVISRKLFELNRKEFITAYGTNDTSIAIINLFFKKRRTATVFLSSEPLPFGGMALGITFMFYSSAAVLTLGCSAVCFIVMPILTIDTLSTWTRKSLYITLKDYKEKKVIPKFVMKKLKV